MGLGGDDVGDDAALREQEAALRLQESHQLTREVVAREAAIDRGAAEDDYVIGHVVARSARGYQLSGVGGRESEGLLVGGLRMTALFSLTPGTSRAIV